MEVSRVLVVPQPLLSHMTESEADGVDHLDADILAIYLVPCDEVSPIWSPPSGAQIRGAFIQSFEGNIQDRITNFLTLSHRHILPV